MRFGVREGGLLSSEFREFVHGQRGVVRDKRCRLLKPTEFWTGMKFVLVCPGRDCTELLSLYRREGLCVAIWGMRSECKFFSWGLRFR